MKQNSPRFGFGTSKRPDIGYKKDATPAPGHLKCLFVCRQHTLFHQAMRVFASLVVIAAASRTQTQHTIETGVDLEAEAASRLDELIDAEVEFSIVNALNATGGCNAADQSTINGAGPSDTYLGKCGREAYNFWYNSFDEDKFAKCLEKTKVKGISRSCSNCLAIGPSFGAQKCKGPCMTDSCAKKCLECTSPVGPKITACTGFAIPGSSC